MKTEHESIVQAVQVLAEKLLQQAAEHFSIPIPDVHIRFDLTGTAAGQARRHPDDKFEIRFNHQLLLSNHDLFLQQTVPHEVAHVIAYRVFGHRIKPHGSEWKMLMTLFNADPQRCHTYDVSAVQKRRQQRFNYQCDCRIHQLTAIRHNRILRGQSYHCLYCKTALQPSSTSVLAKTD